MSGREQQMSTVSVWQQDHNMNVDVDRPAEMKREPSEDPLEVQTGQRNATGRAGNPWTAVALKAEPRPPCGASDNVIRYEIVNGKLVALNPPAKKVPGPAKKVPRPAKKVPEPVKKVPGPAKKAGVKKEARERPKAMAKPPKKAGQEKSASRVPKIEKESNIHAKQKAEKKSHSCGFETDGVRCDFSCGSKIELRDHGFNCHGIVISVRARDGDEGSCCHICGKFFASRRSLPRHLREAHGNYKCRFGAHGCKFVTTSEELEKQHAEEVHQVESVKETIKFPCSVCGAMLTRTSLRKHIKRQHKELMQCPKCPFQSSAQNEFERHAISFHTEVCETCCLPRDPEERKSGDSDANRHECPAGEGQKSSNVMEIIALESRKDVTKISRGCFLLHDGSYLCSSCGFKSTKKITVKRHFELRHVSQGCFVPGCCGIFASYLDLVEHVRLTHVELCAKCGVAQEPSHDCEKTLLSGNSPLIMMIHKKLRPMRCHLCGIITPYYNCLHVHLKNYHGEVIDSAYPHPKSS